MPATHRIALVYDANSGPWSTAVDVLKKLAGREDCSLCALTHGATGKRDAWRACEMRLHADGCEVVAWHRDEVPATVVLPALPCVLALSLRGDVVERVLLDRAGLEHVGSAAALDEAVRRGLGLTSSAAP